MPARAKPGAPCRRCGGPRERPDTGYCNACKARARLAATLKYNFGITVERYEEMLARQGGVCAICKRRPGKRRLAVDHDHSCCPGRRSCGKCVRGLLCKACNYQLLGNILQENKQGPAHAREIVSRVLSYLDGTLFEPDRASPRTSRSRPKPVQSDSVVPAPVPLPQRQARQRKRAS